MSMSRRPTSKQGDLWIATSDLLRTPGHPFYDRLNAVLAKAGFDAKAEELCAPYYADGKGRPSIAPGTYVRMLFVGFMENISSERGIAWRCADSLSLRHFLGLALDEQTPDHSSLCRIRQRLPLEVHADLFNFVLAILAKDGLLNGKTVGVDATTLEANAALRSIVRRDDGSTYNEYLAELAKTSGIETPTRAELARLDKKREKKGSNDDWKNPHDPDAKIVKMKDGRTHLAHKAEHAVDLDTGAIMAVTVTEATKGDVASLHTTLASAMENVATLVRDQTCAAMLDPTPLSELVTDKGYHSNDSMESLAAIGVKSYVSEPDRGRRRWKGKSEARDATYANRRRVRSERGKALLRRRGELLERTFAHCLETGAMRRTHLRGHENIKKRYLLHIAAFNLSLVMRKLVGAGTPRGLASRAAQLVACANAAAAALVGVLVMIVEWLLGPANDFNGRWRRRFSTGC
jgi:transposase